MRSRESEQFGPVLIVDDQWEDAFLIQRLLRATKTTRRICTAGGGPEALSYFKGCLDHDTPIPALVLLDVGMPAKNGYDVLGWMRQHEIFDRVVVVMISASELPFEVGKAQELGAQGYLAKYPSSNDLADILDALSRPACLRRGLPGFFADSPQPKRRFDWH